MSTLIYRVTLDEPVIVTALEGEPNSAVSFDYLPGSALRGMVIGAYMRHFGLKEIDAANPDIQRLFFTNSTRFLNGYLVEPVTNQRSLPAPATWSSPKANDRIIRDSILRPPKRGDEETDEEETEKHVETKSVKGFWVVDGEYANKAKPKRVLNVHNDRNRKAGRALGPNRNPEANEDSNQDRGTIFRYDALAAGQTFEAAILCDDANDMLILKEALDSTNHTLLGGAVSAGYGRVALDIVQIMDGTWEEAPRRTNGRLVITLLSDVILRDAYGQYCTTDAALCQALHPFLSNYIKILDGRAFLDVTMHGGFNRKWGLPLPQMPALKMGSVIELTTKSTPDESKLMELLWNGIGERRNEGFGRVAVNWQPFAPLEEPAKPAAARIEPPKLSEASRKILERADERMKQTLVETNVLRITYRKRYRIQGPITRTQLMRLRAVIKNELRNPTGWERINKFLSDIEGKDAGKKIAQTKIGGHDLRSWLQHPEFKELGSATDDPVVILTLLDAVLERAIKTRTRQEETHG